MKNIFKTVLALMACSAVVVSCGKDDVNKQERPTVGQGTMAVSVNTDSTYNVVSVSSRAGEPILADFYLKIKNVDGEIVKKYESINQMDGVITLPAGDYTVESANGEMPYAQFDAPHYFATKAFSVNIQELTTVDLVCRLANVKTSVAFTDKFLNEVKDVEVVISNGYGVLNFSTTEKRAGFFAPPADGRLQVTVTGARVADGLALTETQYISNVEARQWHKITINLATSGTAGPSIKIDTELVNKDLDVIVPGGDDIIDNNGDEGGWGDDPKPDPDPTPDPEPVGGQPTIAGASFNGIAFDIDQTINVPTTCQTLDVAIAAENKIAKLEVEIISPNLGQSLLEGMGFWGGFDMANPTPTQQASLEELQLVTAGDPIKGKTAHTFSVGTFMGLLGMDASAIGNNHKFKLTVTDEKGNSLTKTLSLILVAGSK